MEKMSALLCRENLDLIPLNENSPNLVLFNTAVFLHSEHLGSLKENKKWCNVFPFVLIPSLTLRHIDTSVKSKSLSLSPRLNSFYTKTAAVSVRNMRKLSPKTACEFCQTRDWLDPPLQHRWHFTLSMRRRQSGPPRTSASSPSRSFLELICMNSAALAAAAAAAYVCTSAL